MREVLLLGSLHLATFFVTAMVCHGQLAADRPAPSQLTEFYLWMSLGGVLGGLFSALVAPLVFKSVLEYPLMMAAACLLRPRAGSGRRQEVAAAGLARRGPAAVPDRGLGAALGQFPFRLRALPIRPSMRIAVVGLAAFATFLLRRRPAVFGTAVAVLAAISLWSVETGTRLLDAQRSFFGILRVEYDPVWNTNQLMHGTTSHGQQSLFESQRHEPQGYYHRTGPLGADLRRAQARAGRWPRSACWAWASARSPPTRSPASGSRSMRSTRPWSGSRGTRTTSPIWPIAAARPRSSWAMRGFSSNMGPQRQFDLLIVDVFSSDSVPVHLTTREALKIYFDRLRPRGLLAIHISSRYLNLEPILGNLAADAGLTARIWRDVAAARAVGQVPFGLGRDGPQPRRSWSAGRRSSLAAAGPRCGAGLDR